jgi:hypothetical protein
VSGKGSKQRPTNKASYDSNYDAIFNKPNGEDHEPERKNAGLPTKKPNDNKHGSPK